MKTLSLSLSLSLGADRMPLTRRRSMIEARLIAVICFSFFFFFFLFGVSCGYCCCCCCCTVALPIEPRVVVRDAVSKKKRKKEKKIIRPRINNDGDCWPVVNKIDRPVAGVSLLFCFCFCFLSFMLKADRVH